MIENKLDLFAAEMTDPKNFYQYLHKFDQLQYDRLKSSLEEKLNKDIDELDAKYNEIAAERISRSIIIEEIVIKFPFIGEIKNYKDIFRGYDSAELSRMLRIFTGTFKPTLFCDYDGCIKEAGTYESGYCYVCNRGKSGLS